MLVGKKGFLKKVIRYIQYRRQLSGVSYLITESVSSVDEGAAVTFTVTTSGVTDGTTLYWTNSGTTTGADFSDGQNSGSVTITSGSGTITRTLLLDAVASESENVILELRTGSVSGPVVATSGIVGVIDKTAVYAVSESTVSVDEGSSVTFTVTTANVANGTTLYWTTTGTAVAADFSDDAASGSFTVTTNSGSIVRTIKSDLTSEGPETFTLSVRTGSISGTVVATSNTVTINDTSQFNPGNTVGTMSVAIPLGDTTFGDGAAAAIDVSGNIYALMIGGNSSVNCPIYEYTGTTGGVAGRSTWGTIASSNYVTAGTNTTLIKYTSEGVPLWATCITTFSAAFPLDMYVDKFGNMYVYLYASGATVTFRNYSSGGGGGSSITLTTGGTTGPTDSADVFLCKYNTSGQLQWCVTVTSTATTSETPFQGICLTGDENGNSYFVFGTVNNTPTLTFKSFASFTGTTVNYSTFGQDTLAAGYRSFVVKVNSDGVIQWVSRMTRQNPATGSHFITGVGTNPSGTIVSVGLYGSTSPGFLVENYSNVAGGVIQYGASSSIVAANSSLESYITGFTSNGTATWISRLTSIVSTGNVVPYNIAVDRDGNTYVGGYCTQTISITSTSNVGIGSVTLNSFGTLSRTTGSNGYVIKYNSNGLCTAGTTISASSGGAQVYALALDTSSNVYAGFMGASTTANSIVMNSFQSAAGNGAPILTTQFGTTQCALFTDCFLIKYNTSLGVQWVTRLDSGTAAGTGDDFPRSIAAHPTSNYVVFAGSFNNLSSAALNIYDVSGVSNGVIQYAGPVTMSATRTTATGSGRSGFLVKYT